MASIIIFCCFLAVFHFVYEAIVLPTLRLNIRFKLFALRDRLRALKMRDGEALDDKHFFYLQDSINGLIVTLHRFNIEGVVKAVHAIASDSELRKRVIVRSKVLDDCRSDQIKAIRERTIELADQTLLANSGGWFLYVIPIALVLFMLTSLKKNVVKVISLPETDLNRLIPADGGTKPAC